MIERQPVGIPSGGQFAPERRLEPLTSLGGAISDEEYNRDGSWQFPPRPRSAKQHIAFWASTPIPDEVLANMTTAFSQRNIKVLNENNFAMQEKFEVIWRPEAKNLVFGRDSREAIDGEADRKSAMYSAYVETHAHEYLGQTPLRIDPTDARTLARAAFTFDGAQQLNRQFTQAEQDKVLDFPVELSTGETTVYGVEDTYRLWAMRDVIQKPALSTADIVRKLQDLEDAIEGRE